MAIVKTQTCLRRLLITGGALLFGGMVVTTQAQSTPGSQPTAGRANRSAPATDKVSAALMPSMDRMMEQMKAAPKTGNPDRDYATLIRIHHQGVIDLAKQGAQKGKDARLVAMAKEQVAQKGAEIAQLDALLPQLPSTPANAEFAQQLSQKLQANTMDKQQDMNGTLTGDFEKDFLNAMIQHNKDDVDLAQTYLKYAQNPALQKTAEQVVATSQKAIEAMKQMIK